jgi:hypothetical protein
MEAAMLTVDEQSLAHGLRPLITETLLVFARMEFALIVASYRKAGYEARAEIDRNAFADDLAASGLSLDQVKGAVSYLTDSRPGRLVINGAKNVLEWKFEPRIDTPSTREVLTEVWQVRNNLAHGSKGHFRSKIANPKRDEELMLAALDVLEACLDHASKQAHGTNLLRLHDVFFDHYG